MSASGHLGWAKFDLHLPYSQSLKDKRAVLHSLKEKIRNATGASVAEVDGIDTWQSATLVFAIVAKDASSIEQAWSDAMRIVQSRNDVVVTDAVKEWRAASLKENL